MSEMDEDLDFDFSKLAEKIKAFRKSMNMSQQDFGKQAGLKAQRIGTIESNRIKATLGDLIRLARTYNMSIDELVFDRPASSRASVPAAVPEAAPVAPSSPYASEEVVDRIIQAVDGLLDRYKEEFANYQDIEAKFDLPNRYIAELKKGNEEADAQLVKGLYRHNVSALWLEFGEGRMFETPQAARPRQREAAAAPVASGTMLERKVEAIYSLQKLMDSKIDDLMDR